MEEAKKARKVYRTAFSNCLKRFQQKCSDVSATPTDRHVALQLLEVKMAELDSAQAVVIELMMRDKDTTEKTVESEMEKHEEYKMQFLTSRMKLIGIASNNESAPAATASVNHVVTQAEKPFKRPTLEIPKFDGRVGSWLQFWSHFQKIHNDAATPKEDKLAYLKQAMEKGSRAETVLEGYPTDAKNYDLAFNALRNRFGRDDLLIEYYTRELLALVLQNAANKGKSVSVAVIFDKVSAHVRALDTLGVKTKECATMLYPLVESSLPEEILRTWQRSMASSDAAAAPNEGAATEDRLTKLLKFLESEVENEERINLAVNGFSMQTPAERRDKKDLRGKSTTTAEVPSASALFVGEDKQNKCIFCGEFHENADCVSAKKMKYEDRKKIIEKNGCCFKCIKRGHISIKCKVRLKCAWCDQRHSILVCRDLAKLTPTEPPVVSEPANSSVRKEVQEKSMASVCNFPDVYLQTLRVVAYSESKQREVRVVLDGGCTRSYIRTEIAKFLGYESIGTRKTSHTLFGGVTTEDRVHQVYTVRLRNLEGNFACNFPAMSQTVICENVPRIQNAEWFQDLISEDISFSDFDPKGTSCNGPIDILIGSDILGKLMTGEKRDLSSGLTALRTELGWVLFGKAPSCVREDTTEQILSMFVTEAKIEDLWSLDVLGIKDPVEKSNNALREELVKENFLKSVTFTKDGRYSVSLPWADDHAPVSSNFQIAEKRLEDTADKLKRMNKFDDYDKVFSEWMDENIIEIVPEAELNFSSHYLPHRPVFKSEGTTKIRPVFDASAHEKGSPALNHCLEKGPNQIELIPVALLRFREHEIAVLADIKKAFLQIEINPSDRDFLRFLWYVSGVLRVLRHRRLVFGLNCSPFLLGAVLEFHFDKVIRMLRERGFEKWHIELVIKLARSFYVDNCVTSVKSEQELRQFIDVAKDVLSSGGFDLRGWEYTRDGAKKETTSVLGLVFNKARDTLSVNVTAVSLEQVGKVTKRSILSSAHKIFDPIGFTSPVTLMPKLLLKKLCKLNSDWDSPVPDEIREEFTTWFQQLTVLSKIEIPRKFGTGNFSLHTFCDASSLAYAAVTFLRVENGENVELRLLAAKSRVAPDKMSIPRLELLAASIGSRQAHEIVEALGFQNVPGFFWSDSTTVLAWIKRDLQWGLFVWNRVGEIRRLTAWAEWRHLPGELNPADLPSRGCLALYLLTSLWWEGPNWLRRGPSYWPKQVFEENEAEINAEMKKSAQVSMFDADLDLDIVSKFSSYEKLLRFFAILIRFKNFLLKKCTNFGGRLTYKEIHEAELKFLRCLQGKMFLTEKDPKLEKLPTFVHSDGLIRVRTQIAERNDSFPFKFPIVLDSKNRAVELLIRGTHERMCHAGVQTVMCHLREMFWIVNMRKAVRSIIAKCVVCKKQNVKPMQANPAPLSRHRVTDTAIFQVTGVDFAGPLILRGKEKAWICLYTCAVYRAVHIDLVTSLSTRKFLGSLRRFTARRGRPSIIFSDNGTNFVGADNALNQVNWDEVSKYSSAQRIDWRFNPPAAPWWGGWWERLIGMLKRLLRKVLGKSSLTYEDMLTVLCDCESTLNSRPLTYLSNDPSSLQALTPAMFLHDLRETDAPDFDLVNTRDLNSKLKYKQEVMEHLRNRFRKEYLSMLILNRNPNEKRSVKIGDVVLVGDDNRKRLDWPLALVEDFILGRDGVPRVVMLKTATGRFKRPIQRIYPLEIQDDLQIELCEKIGKKNGESQARNEPIEAPIGFETCDESRNVTRRGRIIKKPNVMNL